MGKIEVDPYGNEYYDPSLGERIKGAFIKLKRYVHLAFHTSQFKRGQSINEFIDRVEKVDATNTKELDDIYNNLLCKYDLEDGNFGKTIPGEALAVFIDKLSQNENKNDIVSKEHFEYYRKTAMELMQKEEAKAKKNEPREME